jgi:endoglucanase
MQALRDEWGANVFRVAMYTEPSGAYISRKEQTTKNVCKAIDTAIELGLYIIIDWHILSDGDPNKYIEESIDFFGNISGRYADVPNVIYEICNEPNGPVTWSDHIKPYAEAVIPVIRANAKDAIVIVGTPVWSQGVDKAAAAPLTFDNIMYTLHFYAGTHKESLRKTAKSAIDSGIALFVTEWGTTNASGDGKIYEEESNKWIDFMNENYISWCNWSLCDKSEGSALLKPNNPADGNISDERLSESGKYIKTAMKRSIGYRSGQ